MIDLFEYNKIAYELAAVMPEDVGRAAVEYFEEHGDLKVPSLYVTASGHLPGA